MNQYIDFFKVYLFSQKHSKATVKNYVSDVSRFVNWYEKTFPRAFKPEDITDIIIHRYQESLLNKTRSDPGTVLSIRSTERHLASLRKFFSVLKEQSLIGINPALNTITKNILNQAQSKANLIDKHTNAFKDYLYRQDCSSKTIKNYLLDIRQFISWAEKVTSQDFDINVLYKYISNQQIEAYKNRLLHDRQFSPISVNRKLSAIRKYILYLYSEGLIGESQMIDLNDIGNVKKNISDNEIFEHLNSNTEAKLKTEATDRNKNIKRSRFAPVRLLNLIQHGLSIFLDTIFILPLVGVIRKIQYGLLGITGKNIFKSLAKNNLASSNSTPIDNLILKGISEGKTAINLRPGMPKFSNISKSFYDPLNISLTGLPLHKRAYHIIRYKRPDWYKKYHNNPISHYLHFALLLVFIGILTYWIQYNFFVKPSSVQPAFASLPLSPPRILSFKGRLTDDANNPIITEATLRFSLYKDDLSSGSALLWQDVLSVTPNENGDFIALLGRGTPIDDNTFEDNPDIYLGVTRGQNPEMSPREKIATVGLSSDSQSVMGLKPITHTGDTNNTLLALDSAGNLSIGGTNGPTFQATEGSFRISGNTLSLITNIGTDGTINISPDGMGVINVEKPLVNTSENNNFLEAIGSVEVDDTFAILATTSAQAVLNIRQDSTGMLISASSSGTAKFTLDYLGNAMFGNNLAVNGNNLTTNQSTFHLLPENAFNLYIGESSSELTLGSTIGNTTIKNNLISNGNSIFGDSITDSVIFKGRIASNLIASESGKFDLGSESNSFNNAYLNNLFLSPTATTSGFLKRENNTIYLMNATDSFLLGGNTANNALIKLAGLSGQDSFINTGNFGIGTNITPTDKLQVFGDVRIGTTGTDGCLKRFDGTALAGTCSSDTRFKKDIKPIENVLGKLANLRPVTFSMKSDEFPEYAFGEGMSYGLIAQEVEQLFPDLVEVDSNGYKMVKYGPELTMLALSGIKELYKEVNLLKDSSNNNVDINGNVILIKEDQEYRLKAEGRLLNNYSVFAQVLIGKLKAGVINANEAIFDNLAVTTDNLSIAGLGLREYILDVLEGSIINNNSGIITPFLSAQQTKTNFISPLASDSQIGLSLDNSEISILDSNSSTGSAVTRFDRNGNATLSGTLTAKDASIAGTLRAGKIVADDIEGLNEKLATLSASSSNSALVTNIYNIYNNASNSGNTNQQPTPTPAILAENSNTSSQSAEDNLSQLTTNDLSLTTEFIPLASHSAALAYVPNLNTDFSTIYQGLMVLGYTSVVDLSASDRVTIGGNFILAENSINVLGADLEIQPLRQGNIRFMGGLMTLNTEGNLEVFGDANFAKDVSIKGKLSANLIAPIPGSDLIIQLPGDANNSQSIINNANSASLQAINNTKLVVKNASGSGVLSINNLGDLVASGTATFKDAALGSLNIVRGASADTSAIDTVASSSAGLGTITRGYTTRTIYSPYVTKESLIYITPKSQTNNSVPYLARQTPEDPEYGIKGSFTVQIPTLNNQDIQFNWWIIN